MNSAITIHGTKDGKPVEPVRLLASIYGESIESQKRRVELKWKAQGIEVKEA